MQFPQRGAKHQLDKAAFNVVLYSLFPPLSEKIAFFVLQSETLLVLELIIAFDRPLKCKNWWADWAPYCYIQYIVPSDANASLLG